MPRRSPSRFARPPADDTSFWERRRVLVTGHTGFKGSWLSLWLAQRGAEVVGYARSCPTAPCLYELARVGDVVETVEGEIGDVERLTALIASREPEVVFHMAAQPLVRRGYERPHETFATNVMGTVALLEAVRRTRTARVVVNVTSDKCYEDRRWTWPYRETDRLGGADPYSSSKACCELVTAAYRSSFLSEVAVASARAGNVFGGGDFAADRLVPDAMRAAAAGTPLELRNPRAVRPWQHVLNALSGYLRLADRLWSDPSLAGAWNFGPAPDDVRPVAWIADRLCEQWDGLEWRAGDVRDAPAETHALNVDSTKARTLLAWRPPWDLAEGLAQTVAWHRALAAGADMREVTLEQLEQFEPARPAAAREAAPA